MFAECCFVFSLCLIGTYAGLWVVCMWTDAASKHATQAYFDCLRAEVKHCGIHVSVISPGYIRTNLSVNAVTGDGSKYGGEMEMFATVLTWKIV